MSYTVRDVIERIRFYTATENELIGKAANELFSNKNIVGQLKFALDAYAKTTKALQTIYSLPVDKEVAVIDEPPYILRSEGIRFFVWFINGYAYPISEQNLNNTYANFPSPIQGLPKWFNYWNDTITFYPQNGNGYNRTILAYDLGLTDTVIEVESTSGFAPKNGRITIGNEKIKYEYKDGTHFYNCTRGIEDTETTSHDYGECVHENNVWVYYHRLHFDIPVNPDDSIREEILNKKMLIVDEHIEIICNYAAFCLLSKVDAQRASYYKVNFDEWLRQAKRDIIKGRSRIQKTGWIREPYQFEQESAYWGL
jgi:hypothetical protein